MRVAVSDDAIRFIRGHGGRAWVWLDHGFEASTDPPEEAARFQRVPGDGFELYLGGTLAEEGQVAIGLRRFPRRRLVARVPGNADLFWKGVAVEHQVGERGLGRD